MSNATIGTLFHSSGENKRDMAIWTFCPFTTESDIAKFLSLQKIKYCAIFPEEANEGFGLEIQAVTQDGLFLSAYLAAYNVSRVERFQLASSTDEPSISYQEKMDGDIFISKMTVISTSNNRIPEEDIPVSMSESDSGDETRIVILANAWRQMLHLSRTSTERIALGCDERKVGNITVSQSRCEIMIGAKLYAFQINDSIKQTSMFRDLDRIRVSFCDKGCFLKFMFHRGIFGNRSDTATVITLCF